MGAFVFKPMQPRKKPEGICTGSRACHRKKLNGYEICQFHDLLQKARAGDTKACRQLLELYDTKVYTRGEIRAWQS